MRLHHIFIALMIVISLAFAVIAPVVEPAHAGMLAASSKVVWHDHHHRKHRRHHHRRHAGRKHRPHRTPKPAPKPQPAPPVKPPFPNGPKYMIGQDQDCAASTIVSWLRAHGTNVMKLGVSPVRAGEGFGVDCVQAARQAGYPIFLNVDFPAAWTAQQDSAFALSTMKQYGGSYWAISLANEPDLHGWTTDHYFDTWQTVAPSVHAADPAAKLALGEFSPWGVGFAKQVIARQPVDVGMVAFHCYDVNRAGGPYGLNAVPELAQFAQAHGYQLGCTEMAPDLAQYGAPGWISSQSRASYDANVAKVWDWTMTVSYYYWPQIGAN